MPNSATPLAPLVVAPSRARSEQMARVRAKGNKSTELTLIEIFRRGKIVGWRRHPKLLGNPDFVFLKCRTVLFVDGCFWHGCPEHGRMPKSNVEFWSTKIANNRKRDRTVSRYLRKTGWAVIRLWEHDLRKRNRSNLMRRLQRRLLEGRISSRSAISALE